LRQHKFFRGVAPLTVAAMLLAVGLAACGSSSPADPSRPAGLTAAPAQQGAPAGEAAYQDALSEPLTQIAADEPGSLELPVSRNDDDAAGATEARQPTDASPDQTLQNRRDVVVEPGQFRQLLLRDAIAPIYEPQFIPADQANMDSKELVIGVEINGESRAYPVGPLNRREMVNDVVGGVPILVTW